MTDIDRIVYKDRIQRCALELLQNADVQADVYPHGVILFVTLYNLGHIQILVRWEDDLSMDWLAGKLETEMAQLCKRKYFRLTNS